MALMDIADVAAEAVVRVWALNGDLLAEIVPMPKSVRFLKEALQERTGRRAELQKLMMSDGLRVLDNEEHLEDLHQACLAPRSTPGLDVSCVMEVTKAERVNHIVHKVFTTDCNGTKVVWAIFTEGTVVMIPAVNAPEKNVLVAIARDVLRREGPVNAGSSSADMECIQADPKFFGPDLAPWFVYFQSGGRYRESFFGVCEHSDAECVLADHPDVDSRRDFAIGMQQRRLREIDAEFLDVAATSFDLNSDLDDADKQEMHRTSIRLTAVRLRDKELWPTNIAYVAKAEHVQLVGESAGQLVVDLNGFLFACEAHPDVEQAQVWISKVQRECAGIELGEVVEVIAHKVAGPFLKSMQIACDPCDPAATQAEVDGDDVGRLLAEYFRGRPFSRNQQLVFDYKGALLKVSVLRLQGFTAPDPTPYGILLDLTDVEVVAGETGRVQLHRRALESLVQRMLASRSFPSHVVQELRLHHTRGLLLYGLSGTSKVSLASKISSLCGVSEPRIIGGQEVLAGDPVSNINELFGEAEAEYAAKGEASQLHIIIVDGIDLILPQRDPSSIHDGIANQLAAKLDHQLPPSNSLLIGTAGRRNAVDWAMLRAGRLDFHVEVMGRRESADGRVEFKVGVPGYPNGSWSDV